MDLVNDTENMDTLLLIAAQGYNWKEIKLLIERGANVNVRDDTRGRSLLHQAVVYGNRHDVQFLIDSGADINAKDKHGRTPLNIAAMFGLLNMLRVLLEAGANPFIQSSGGYTARGVAQKEANSRMAKMLQEYEDSFQEVKEPGFD